MTQFRAGDQKAGARQSGPRPSCLEAVQGYRKAASDGHAQGRPAAELVRKLSTDFDGLIASLFAGAGIPPSAMLSLVALGGYGRGELYPYSDLDLLVLVEGDATTKDEDLSARVVDQVIYPLWDAKVNVGYAVRGLEETLELAARDLTVCTALLDARMLAGEEGPFHALQAAAWREFFGPDVRRFIGSLREERSARHRRFGETVYLLEPNLKLGKGGLRDLNTGLWAAKARFGVSDLGQISSVGGATARQGRNLSDAHEFLRSLRLAMHLHAGRSQDHLLFELQEALAPRFYPAVEVRGVKRRGDVEPAVERLMHAYYRHARNVVLETEGLFERCSQENLAEHSSDQTGSDAQRALRVASQRAPRVASPGVSEQQGEHLVVVGGALRSQEPSRFWEEPSEIVRAFQQSLATGAPFHWETRDQLAEAVADEPGAQLPADARAAELWLDLLCHPEREGESTVLMEAHDLGVLAALIPEFEACTGRIQHDMYHVYTVDLHSLYVLALLKAWRRGEQADRYPMAIPLMQGVQERRGLFVAALLHDVGKPLGHGHASKGARLAVGIAARLGMSAEEQEEVRLLVDEHLTMAHLSQRRDLFDPTVIRTLADQVGTVDRLRKLYLLTLADTAMTSPGNLTEWKASLLDELYMRTYFHLSHGEGSAAMDRDQLLRDRQGALELELRRAQGDAAAAIVKRVPPAMLLSFSVEDLLRHLRVALELEAHPEAVLRVETRARQQTTAEITVSCWDAPFRLAAITGVMLARRIEILAAQVNTLEPSLSPGASDRKAMVLDVFTVRLPHNGEEVCAAFASDLEQAILGRLSVTELVQRHTRPSGLPPRVVPRVETLVTVDNTISERLTVIDVQAPDRLGVLHAITRTLSEQDLAIHLSKVATEAGRVIDIFYVSDGPTGGKVTDEARLGGIRRKVLAAIAALSPERAT